MSSFALFITLSYRLSRHHALIIQNQYYHRPFNCNLAHFNKINQYKLLIILNTSAKLFCTQALPQPFLKPHEINFRIYAGAGLSLFSVERYRVDRLRIQPHSVGSLFNPNHFQHLNETRFWGITHNCQYFEVSY